MFSRKVNQVQTVESEKGTGFIASIDEVQKIRICIDNSDTQGTVVNKQIFLSVYNAEGKRLFKQAVTEDAIQMDQFGDSIALTKLCRLNKGELYYYDVQAGGEPVEGISVQFIGKEISFLIFNGTFFLSVVMIAFAVFILFRYKFRDHLVLVFFVSAVSIGLLYNFIMPSLNTPDEFVHFSQAYRISNIMLGVNKEDSSYVYVNESGIRRITGDIGIQNTWDFWSDWSYGNQKSIYLSDKFPVVNTVPLFVYVPAGFAIFITRLAHLPYQIVLLSGRISNLIIFLLLSIISMRVYKPFRYVVAAIAMLPATLWLVASYSYDGWNLGFCILFVVLCMRIREQACGVRVRDIILLLMVLILFAPVKYIYVIIGLAVFLVPLDQWKDKRLLAICGMAAVLAGIAMAFSRGREAIAYLTTSSMDVRGQGSIENQSYTIGWVIRHPINVLWVYAKTLILNIDQFVTKGMTGEFYGVYVPTFLTALVLITFLLLMITGVERSTGLEKCRSKGIAIFIIGCLTVFTAFLFIYSTVSESMVGTIGGMQGRYFIPYFIFLPMAMYSPKLTVVLNDVIYCICGRKIQRQKVLLFMLILLNLCIVYCKFQRMNMST